MTSVLELFIHAMGSGGDEDDDEDEDARVEEKTGSVFRNNGVSSGYQ